MAVKSLVNDDVEMLGIEEDVDEVAVVALEHELLLLPQPTATAAATRVSTDTRNHLRLITARPCHRRAKVNID